MLDYEYRILVGPKREMLEGWNFNLNFILSRMVELREFYKHNLIVVEISPWYRDGDITYCPGCEYAGCPVCGMARYRISGR